MYDERDFKKDFAKAQKLMQKHHPGPKTSLTADVKVETAWQLYQHASHPSLAFHVFGRRIKDKEIKEWRAANPDSDVLPGALVGLAESEGFQENFGKSNNSSTGTGSILSMTSWNFTINDTWLVGGIHAQVPFYAASILTRENLLDQKHVLTITGRELVEVGS